MVAPAEGELEYELMLDAAGGTGRRSTAAQQPEPPPEDLEPGMYKAGRAESEPIRIILVDLRAGSWLSMVEEVSTGTAVYRSSTQCSDRDVVAHVDAGQRVKVEEAGIISM